MHLRGSQTRGPFFTRMLASNDRETFKNYTDPNHPAVIKFKKYVSRGIPSGRLGDAPDIIGATIFLMSQAHDLLQTKFESRSPLDLDLLEGGGGVNILGSSTHPPPPRIWVKKWVQEGPFHRGGCFLKIFTKQCSSLIRQEKRAQRLTFWVRRPPGGVGGFHSKGWWPKSSCPPSKVCLPWVSKEGIRDVPGFLPGCPGPLAVFKKFVQKKFVRIFRSLFKWLFITNARLFITLFVRNFRRVCSQFWLSVRNSV